MDLLSIVEIWRYLNWLPKYFLRRIFTKERLADLVLMDVQARHEPVRANLGDIASYAICFQVINMSPFDVELDRAEIDFLCAGTTVSKQYIRKTVFKAGQAGTLHVSGEIDTAKAAQISRHHKDNKSSISLHCEFNCILHSFTKVRNNLEGVYVHFVNAEWRRTTLEEQ